MEDDGGGEGGRSPMMRSQSVNESVALDCDLHKSFTVLFHLFFFIRLGETGRVEGAELGISLPAGGLDSGKTPAGEAL